MAQRGMSVGGWKGGESVGEYGTRVENATEHRAKKKHTVATGSLQGSDIYGVSQGVDKYERWQTLRQNIVVTW